MAFMSVKPLLVILAMSCTQCQRLVDDLDSFIEALDQAIAAAEKELKQPGNMTSPDHNGSNQPANETKDDPISMSYTAMDSKDTLKADIALTALTKLLETGTISLAEVASNTTLLEIWRQRFNGTCPSSAKKEPCDPDSPYRTANGYCNNLGHPAWGAAMTPQLRELAPVYEDGISKPRLLGKDGDPLPGARVISNKIFNCTGKSPRNPRLSVMVMQWGQFIDHDFVSTPVMKETGGESIPCCDENNRNRRECHRIDVPDNDTYFQEQGCINFVRSAPSLDIACTPGPREQVNKITGLLDGSAIYGSSLKQTRKLRTMTSGLLKTTKDNLLPHDVPTACTLTNSDENCQLAGDSRVNVVPSLGLSHLTFVRKHNLIARDLSQLNPHWNDETIFQETRRIIVAIEQHIHYNEYLPVILNEDTMSEYRLTLSNSYSDVYNDAINPSISNVFGVAAFRFGHSQIPDYQAAMSTDKRIIQYVGIQYTYHNPHMLVNDQGEIAGDMVRWLAYDAAPEADSQFEDGTRNFLFLNAKGHSLDLVAINTQRSRDHAIPPYSHWRKLCNLEPTNMTNNGTFLLPDHQKDAIEKLMGVYSHVDDIDLTVGAMTETLLPNSQVGPTFACLLGRQFQRLKEGDRFWYESQDERIRFTKEQLNEIKKIRFSKLFCDSYELDQLQPNVFKVPGQDNMIGNCSLIPSLNLTKWISCSDTNAMSLRPQYDLTRCKNITDDDDDNDNDDDDNDDNDDDDDDVDDDVDDDDDNDVDDDDDDDDYSSGSNRCNSYTGIYFVIKLLTAILVASCELHH